jgi:hypothetical protein
MSGISYVSRVLDVLFSFMLGNYCRPLSRWLHPPFCPLHNFAVTRCLGNALTTAYCADMCVLLQTSPCVTTFIQTQVTHVNHWILLRSHDHELGLIPLDLKHSRGDSGSGAICYYLLLAGLSLRAWSTFFRNVGELLPEYMASHSRKY